MKPRIVLFLLLSICAGCSLLVLTYSEEPDFFPVSVSGSTKSPALTFTPSSKLSRLFFFCVIANFEDPVLIAQFLDHYLSLGVLPQNMHVDFQVGKGPTKDEPLLRNLLVARGIEHVSIWDGPWSDPMKLQRGNEALEIMGVKKGDWILHVDSDEFQEYPMALGDFLEECDSLGISLTQAFFHDRVSETGELVKVTRDTKVTDFPWACQITRRVLKGNYNKLGPFKFGMKPFSGGYHSMDPIADENVGLLAFRALRTHHVKWVQGVVKELENRENNVPKEALALHDFVKAHDGKICVTCPEVECVRVKDLPRIPTPREAINMTSVVYKTVKWVPPTKAKEG